MSVMLFFVVLPHRLPYRIQNEPTFILYDAEGKHGECAEGPETYIKECVQKSNLFFYFLAGERHPPTLAGNTTCSALGYTYVTTDSIFTGFSVYWMGGAAAAGKFSGPFAQKHPLLHESIVLSKAGNPACN